MFIKLTNEAMHCPWGSTTAIAAFRAADASGLPEAELWLAEGRNGAQTWAGRLDRTGREEVMRRTTRVTLVILGLVVLVGIVIYLNRRGVFPDVVAIPIQLALTICAGLVGVRANRPDH